MNDNIEYSGEVTIYHKGKNSVTKIARHNKGTQNLFNLICRLLTGYSVNNGLPTYLKLVDTQGNSLINPEQVALTGITYQTDANNDYYIRYNAVIEYEELKQEAFNVDKATFQICGADEEKTALAEMSVDGQELKISQGVVIVIEWKMYFRNKVSE